MRPFVELADATVDAIELALIADLKLREERGELHPIGGYSSPRFVDRITIHNDRMRHLGKWRD